MSITKRISLLIVLALLTGPAFGQITDPSESRSGSVYSAVGVGYPIDLTSAVFKSQGVFGISSLNRESSNISNPALWGRTLVTRASTGIQFSSFSTKTDLSTEKNTNLEASYLHVVLPFKRDRFGVSVGMFPITRSNYSIVDLKSFNTSPTDTVYYTNEVRSFGGLNKFEVGFGLKLTKNISIGYAPSFVFMNLENSEKFRFSSATFTTQTQKATMTGNTLAHRFGLAIGYGGVFRKNDVFSLGATLNLPFSIDAEEDFKSQKSVEGIGTEVDLSADLAQTDGSIKMPLEAAFGLGYAPSAVVNFSAEGMLQKWGDFSNDLRPGDEVYLKDRFRFGGGIQFHPYKRNSNLIFSRFKYSAGVSYDTGHLRFDEDDISTLWLNAGIGLLSRTASSIDLSIQYGIRGTTNNNLIEERIWSFGFSVNLTESMFIRPKLR